MYAKGMSQRDIADTVKDIYGFNISHETVSEITDKVLEELNEWQNRPLKKFYTFLFVDCMYVTIRKDYEVKNYAVYAILGYDQNGRLLTTITPDGTVETCIYNAAGQLIQKKIAYKDNVVTHKYSYDETYKTISESAEIQNESIYPELNGTGNFNDAVMSYGNGNRLETYNGKTLTYDNDGNMTNAPLNGTMTEYVYDKYNNLISVGTT